MRPALFLTLTAVLAAADADFDTRVQPILKSNCLGCHTGAAAQAGLDLSSAAAILKGGKTGPAIKPGAAAESLLVSRVASRTMPPGNTRKLSDEEITVIRSWVDAQPRAVAAVTEKDVMPIFQMRCTVCHGKRKQEGGLDLRTMAGRLKGGKSGPALVPGKPGDSLLMQKITSGAMPPPKLLFEAFVRPPSSPEVETLRQWIAAGAPPAPAEAVVTDDPLVTAKDRQFWSFQPPRRPAVPGPGNPIDAFLKPAGAPASKPVLLRRAFLAITGLPPTPADLKAFLADQRPDAFERLVDRLLESPEFGERWAQFWLDAAGYADSEGIIDEDKIRPDAWRYRDYVIRALNAGKPYDRFLTEQLAGDELVDYRNLKNADQPTLDTLAATGFLRMAPDGTYSPANGSVAERMNVIADEVEVLGSAVLGLTVNCARCHNHKYDPIPQRDYYRLSAILHTAFDPYDWVKPTERNLDIALADERREAEKHNAPLEAELKRLESELEAKKKVKPEPTAEIESLNKSVAELKRKLVPKPRIRALYDMGGDPSPSYLLKRGDAQLIGEQVQPGVLSVLRDGIEPLRIQPPRPDSSGRRLALARWLTQPSHPLTARVQVNRIWMHYFGKGIVASPANFGRTGVAPAHPELLDWLATEFVGSGWNMKQIHRLILTSKAWQQSGPPRRMDAEQLRDSILKVTERLDVARFGPPVAVETKGGGEIVSKSGKQGFRRSIYLIHRRTTPETMLEVFDLPAMSPNCIERASSNVSPQALQLTNSETIRSHARFLAARLLDRHSNIEAAIEELYLRAFTRRPEAAEVDRAVKSMAQMERHWLTYLADSNDPAPRAATARWYALGDVCHALLSSAEFSYVD